MKNIKFLFLLIASVVYLSGCMKDLKTDEFTDDAISSVITVTVNMPEGYNYTTEGLPVYFVDPSSGLEFCDTTNASGVATIRVPHGAYIATTETKHSAAGGVVYIFNGVSEKIRVAPNDPKNASSKIDLNVSKAGQIVLKELYYGGCTNPATSKSYSKDQYFILYNNSGEVAYLDSLCLAVVDPYNAPSSGKTTNWVKPNSTEIRDSIPVSGFGWMFPGTGNQHPLQPGEQVVISLNAINHVPITSTSVNLGIQGYWAAYDPLLTKGQSTPNAGVNLMTGFWKVGTATSWVVSTLSPAVFLYSMGGKTPTQFITDTYTWNPGYATNRNFDCLMVDKNLIIDGVECFRNVTDSKRLRPEVDNGFAMVDGGGQGQSVHRRVDAQATAAAGGRIVYMDTNNSSNDFEKRTTASLVGVN